MLLEKNKNTNTNKVTYTHTYTQTKKKLHSNRTFTSGPDVQVQINVKIHQLATNHCKDLNINPKFCIQGLQNTRTVKQSDITGLKPNTENTLSNIENYVCKRHKNIV